MDQAAEQLKGLLVGGTPKETTEDVVETPEVSDVTEEVTEATEVTAEAAEEARPAEAEQEAEDQIQLDADQFAGLLGIDTDDLVVNDEGQVRIRTRVDGEEGDATPSDLLERYQRDANLTNRSKKVAELEKSYKQKVDDFTQQTTTQAQQAATLLEAIDQAYQRDFASVNWEDLRADNPGEYAAQRQAFSERQTQKDALIQKTLTMLDNAQATAQNEQAEFINQKLVKEEQSMQAAFKAMDVKVDKALQEGVRDYIGTTFDDTELASMTPTTPLDKLAILAYKAMQYDKGMSKAKDKKVKSLPKVLKPGQKPSQGSVKVTESKAQIDKLKKTGKIEDAAAALKSRLRG
jgi:hypothetical protein